MTWYYKESPIEEIPDGCIGFVYLIENLVSHRLYIGKKLFQFSKTKQVKGKKKRFKVDSDWLTYYGSNDELKEDVAALGVENFRRTILYLCKNKGTMSYLEAKEQFAREVLESDLYYNSWISAKIHRNHVKLEAP